ncbi:hypothetical protein D3C86_2058390 [compost metagenome]
MSEAVIFFIKSTVVDAERAGEVKNHATGCKELRREVMTDFVCRGQKHHVHAFSKLADIGHRLQREIDDSLKLRMQIGN